MAAQWYLKPKNGPLVKWVESHPEWREGHSPQNYSYQNWGIFIADCYASAKAPPQDIPYSTYDIPAATIFATPFHPNAGIYPLLTEYRP